MYKNTQPGTMTTIRVGIIIWVALLATPIAAQTPSLKWKWSQGDQYDVTLTQTTNAKTKVDAREKTNQGATTIRFNWTVIDVADNGDATLEQSLVSIQLSTGNPEIPSQAVNYDTASDQKISKTSKKLRDQIMPLIGMKFSVVMSARGEIKGVTLPPASTELLNGLPDTLRLRVLFSESGLKELQGAAAIVLPEKELAAGESWAVEQPTLTPFGKFTRVRTYTYVGEKTSNGHRLAEFTLTSSFEPEKPDADSPPSRSNNIGEGEALAGHLIDSSSSGTLIMDIDDGYFTSRKISNQTKTDKPFREMKIISTITNEIEMTLKKK